MSQKVKSPMSWDTQENQKAKCWKEKDSQVDGGIDFMFSLAGMTHPPLTLLPFFSMHLNLSSTWGSILPLSSHNSLPEKSHSLLLSPKARVVSYPATRGGSPLPLSTEGKLISGVTACKQCFNTTDCLVHTPRFLLRGAVSWAP